jgi:flagellar motor switch protein FliM
MAETGSFLQRRMVGRGGAGFATGPAADRCWRLALSRAARDAMTLRLDVAALQSQIMSLTELLDLPPARALIAVLDGPVEGIGLLILSPDVLAGMVEVQTMGRVTAQAPLPRKPSRTDAAMVAGFVDQAMEDLEMALMTEVDLTWTEGFRYASFMDDPRPLGLMLEDEAYRVLTTEVSLEDGAKSGLIILALPAVGRGRKPVGVVTTDPLAGEGFMLALGAQVAQAEAVLDVVVGRVSMTLQALMGLGVEDVLTLNRAGLDRVSVEGVNGAKVAEGRLGQSRGQRAVMLMQVGQQAELPVGGLPATGTG